MQTKRNIKETGNVLLCVLGAILIVSIIGATVLRSATTRLNASTNQVRAWKEALSAAETGGDIGFAEIRKQLSPIQSIRDSQWVSTPEVGWTNSGTTHVLSPETTFGDHNPPELNLRARTVVEECYFDPTTKLLTLGHPSTGNSWYRLRSKGTAPLPNLKRTGMDDALTNDGLTHFAPIGSTAMQDITARGKGNSLLRKIDFKYDHFVATYGPNGDGLNPQVTPAPHAPSISRRIEQIVTPVTPFFDAAIMAAGTFYGLGSASYIDSYNHHNGPYDPTVRDNSSSPFYSDSRHGNVEINSATATVKGSIYGDVGTNGGNVTSGNPGIVYGTIDNNVPFTLKDYVLPDSLNPLKPGGMTPINMAPMSDATTLTPTATGTNQIPMYYAISSIPYMLTVAPVTIPPGNPPGSIPQDTYVAIHVGPGGDISGGAAGITVNSKVHVKIYFEGNINIKAQNVVNQSPDTPVYPLGGVYAGSLQFYGISPTTPGQTQSITLTSGGGQVTVAATFYAPSADFQFTGAPDFFGIAVCKTFYANGNITWHYDRALNDDGTIQDYRIASYIEDTR
jgi:hypothetical protein